jgi:hypothetical protein
VHTLAKKLIRLLFLFFLIRSFIAFLLRVFAPCAAKLPNAMGFPLQFYKNDISLHRRVSISRALMGMCAYMCVCVRLYSLRRFTPLPAAAGVLSSGRKISRTQF